MEPAITEAYTHALEQFATISAVLGGLVCTAAAGLLTLGTDTDNPTALRRPAQITIGSAIISTLLFILAAVIWSTLGAIIAVELPESAQEASSIDGFTGVVQVGDSAMLAGLVALFTSVGGERVDRVSTARHPNDHRGGADRNGYAAGDGRGRAVVTPVWQL